MRSSLAPRASSTTTTSGRPATARARRGCITVAMDLLASGPRRVELRAVGKAVTIAEILKHKMPLHQVTALSSCEVVGVYAPLEEGLDDVVNRHYVSCVSITLSADLGPGID